MNDLRSNLCSKATLESAAVAVEVDRRVIKRPFRVYIELDRADRNQSIGSRGTYISMQITSTLYAKSIAPRNFPVPSCT